MLFTYNKTRNRNNEEFKKIIEDKYKNVKCISSSENIGMRAGNNLGIKTITNDFALILNPDTKLYPETLNSFISLANDIKDFAIIGPGIVEGDDLHKITIKQEKYPFIETHDLKG